MLTFRAVLARFERFVVAIIAGVAVIAYCWVYTRADAEQPVHSDGYNYYLYAASWVVYHDVSLDLVSNDWNGGAYPDFAGMLRWPGTGHWVNRIPIGVSILMLPFVAAADLLTRWSNFPRDGYSFYYQHAAGLSAVAYFIAGLALLQQTLLRHFSRAVTAATLVVLTFGTDLFHYAVYDGTFSHAFSFALVAALVELTDRWWTRPGRTTAAALGLVAALIVLVRHTNALFLLAVPLWHVERAGEWWDRRKDFAIMAAVGAGALAPQFAYYVWATGHWFVNPYLSTGLHFTFLAPHFYGVLFSPQRGLFFWAPVLGFAAAGFMVAGGWSRDVRAGALIALVTNAWLIASWSEWQYGASFGHRAFIDGFAIAAIFVAAFFAWVAKRPRLVPGVAAAVTLATILSVAQMVQYWMHVWPARDITWDQYRSLFLSFQ